MLNLNQIKLLVILFPVRYNNKITYNNYGETQYNAWYTSVDIDIGKDMISNTL